MNEDTPRWKAEKFPALFAFAGHGRYDTPEEASGATPEERIASVWPYLCRRVLSFSKKLTNRELANFDPEDTTQELWLMLRQKDHAWEPERGPYVSFAAALISRHLLTVREVSHTVKSPRNSLTRLHQFAREAAEGPLSEKKLKTLADILRSSSGIGSLDEGPETSCGPSTFDVPCHSTPYDALAASDQISVAEHAVEQGLMILNIEEAKIIGRSCGLWGQVRRSHSEIAEELGLDADYVKRVKARAAAKVRDRLVAMGHPAVASDN